MSATLVEDTEIEETENIEEAPVNPVVLELTVNPPADAPPEEIHNFIQKVVAFLQSDEPVLRFWRDLRDTPLYNMSLQMSEEFDTALKYLSEVRKSSPHEVEQIIDQLTTLNTANYGGERRASEETKIP